MADVSEGVIQAFRSQDYAAFDGDWFFSQRAFAALG
jgi:hypothetical protein